MVFSYLRGCRRHIFVATVMTLILTVALLLRPLPPLPGRRTSGSSLRAFSGQVCQNGWWDSDSGPTDRWQPAPGCAYRDFPVEAAVACLSRQGRVLYLGDSVTRGLFWDLVDLFRKGLEGKNLEVQVVKRFVAESYTNFEDQDMYVLPRDGNQSEALFSVRFVYTSNVAEFEGRCKYISDWFFQCLDTAITIFEKVMGEEPEVGLLFWNSGLWDWRTGVSTSQYAEGVAKLLEVADGLFARARRVVWRTTSASWPDKFMSADECAKKPHAKEDSGRPCPVHTDQLKHYNGAVKGYMDIKGFATVDAWPVTVARPDLSYDGLHFQPAHCMAGKARACDSKTNPVYRTLNNMLMSAVCPREAREQ